MQRRIIPDIVPRFKITSVLPDATAYTGAKLMADLNIAALIVVDSQGKLVGIVTERDMTQRVLATGLDVNNIIIKDIMTTNPDTLSPDDSAIDAFELMQNRGYRHLPVTENGKCISIVSIRDLYSSVKDALEEDIKETEAFVFGDRYET